jgi:glycosyltransferase involved in cell wall biosynthesis
MTRDAWHIITGEFPPAPGGVSDYTLAVARGLAGAGEIVHVWCPDAAGARPEPANITVHRLAGPWTENDLAAVDATLDQMPAPKRLLIQWVPHAFGRRSLNLAFCRWVRRRGRKGDIVDLMVHEPFLAFREGSIRQDAAAAVHRVMVGLMLSVARRVWVSIPAWSGRLRPWTFGRHVEFCWLPVPSNIPLVSDDAQVAGVRADVGGGAPILVGHFSTYGAHTRRDLDAVVPPLLAALGDARLVLLGRGGELVAGALRNCLGADASRIVATGSLDAARLSCHLQACDLLLQPYRDGASTRRGTLMAALAHGLPVVTTLGRLSEPFWANASEVTAVASDDHAALVAAATALARDSSRRRMQSAAARALYDRRFDLRHTVQALYDDACQAV